MKVYFNAFWLVLAVVFFVLGKALTAIIPLAIIFGVLCVGAFVKSINFDFK